MDKPTHHAPERVKNVAAGVLAAAFGAVRLDGSTPVESSDRSSVLRFQLLDKPEHAPATAIVKRAVAADDGTYDPDQPGGPAARLFNEWASLQFLGHIAPDRPFAPRFYGGDRDAGILVMEELGPLTGGLTESLLGGDGGRPSAHHPRFTALRAALGPPDPSLGHARLAATFHAMLDAVRLSSSGALDRDLVALEASIANPGPFTAVSHGDPCPGNWVWTDAAARLLDFEFARVGHALLDGVYGQAPVPTCWCIGQLPTHVIEAMEPAHRRSLAAGALLPRMTACTGGALPALVRRAPIG